MCGRFVSVSSPDRLAAHFHVDEVRTDPLEERYNVAPTQDVYALIDREAKRRLGALHWGLVPFWADSPRKGPRPINARLETVTGNMFADSFRRRRCIIPADGFYEWQRRQDLPHKQPYYIHPPDDDPWAFAGLWSVWRDDDDNPLYTCAIVTAAAAGPVADLHDRMPLILPADLWDGWLRSDDHRGLHHRALGLGAPDLRVRRITTRVNDVRNEGPQLLEAV